VWAGRQASAIRARARKPDVETDPACLRRVGARARGRQVGRILRSRRSFGATTGTLSIVLATAISSNAVNVSPVTPLFAPQSCLSCEHAAIHDRADAYR
jgi:hypothetical protein